MNIFKKSTGSNKNSPVNTPTKNSKKENLKQNESGVTIVKDDPNTPKIKEQKFDKNNNINEIVIDIRSNQENLLDIKEVKTEEVEESNERLEEKESKRNMWELLGQVVNQVSKKIVEEEEKISSGKNTPDGRGNDHENLLVERKDSILEEKRLINLEEEKKEENISVNEEIVEEKIIDTIKKEEIIIEEKPKEKELEENQKRLIDNFVKQARSLKKSREMRKTKDLELESRTKEKILRLSTKREKTEVGNEKAIEVSDIENQNDEREEYEKKVLLDEDQVDKFLKTKLVEFLTGATEEVKEDLKKQRGNKTKSQMECNHEIINKMEKRVSEELKKVQSPREEEEVDPHEKEREEMLTLIADLIKKNKRLSRKLETNGAGGWFTSDFGTSIDEVLGGGQNETGTNQEGGNVENANNNTANTSAPSSPTELVTRAIKWLWNSGWKFTAIGGLCGFLLGTYVLGSVIKALFTTINSNITDATAKAFVESLESLGGGVILAVIGMIIGAPIDVIVWCVRKRWVLPQRRQRNERLEDLEQMLANTQSTSLQEALRKMMQESNSQVTTPNNGGNGNTNLMLQENLV
ncbi:MAG: hypothetical protein COZ46_01890 [Verrucomicrobia bacterium CG_4_10_14_3_um_filter_43_23]|nr:MAG: hypothetical protein AUJ82_01905 [Verrucomicrobia bacterium CG1_02_43_26]PIP59649.1 MAG: hypothetical protein COX01_03495 [Verrucomicrobia bacterium CG22_combo_CG10-13_8_21_14_all_43_17]PIX58948.1 MAG: hypothetical protein COZ46_01890 [Verrucomicrobia bacterium CG_4_10_14_3_um_filter_43_23]PIY63093.1 MAG: hypothetical protein COY94_00240 [Verrucomicrobia bacterium CG_4_10_14_0_8_um_filter_43_34]PJA43600.1 MAG: hypothetical protein CO175_07165 [Verrucomicrobia bacterium CG_4_9_14_3_um_fi